MTREEIMKKLEEIRNKGKNNVPENLDGTSDRRALGETTERSPEVCGPEPIHLCEHDELQTVQDNVEAPFDASPELRELAMKWGAEIGITGKLISNTISMQRKDYLKHVKTSTQESLLSDPLLYILFRSEEQGEPNFFAWLEKFPKEKV